MGINVNTHSQEPAHRLKCAILTFIPWCVCVCVCVCVQDFVITYTEFRYIEARRYNPEQFFSVIRKASAMQLC
jgi:hypothetical protein